MNKRILTIVLAGAIALASAATLAGCGEKKDDNKKVMTTTAIATTKPVATTAAASTAANATDANGNNTQATNSNNLSTIAPNADAANVNNSNGIVDAALAAGGYSKANGFWGTIYTSYDVNGTTYYAVNILDENNMVQTMIWVSPDGTTFDDVTFYNNYIAPDYNADPNKTVEQSPTYYIGQDGHGYPTTPVYADEGDYDGEDNTVAAYQGE